MPQDSDLARPKESTSRRIVREYFRTTSSAGQSEARDGPFSEADLKGLRRRLGRWLSVRDRDVLDLGSGTGEMCELAIRSGARSVVGVNLSADEIRYAESRTRARFVCDDVLDYLVARPAASCDTIFALNILEHLDKNTVSRVLEQCCRVLRPGGRLVAVVPNATSPFGMMTRYWDITHEAAFTPSSLRQLARLSGFDMVEVRECGPVPHGIVSGIRFVLWQVIRAIIWSYLMIELASGKGGIYTADMMVRFTRDGGRG